MPTVYVIQTGRTVWDEQARVESGPGAPLGESGRQDVADAAAELSGHEIATLYASPGQAEQQTAAILAEALAAKVRTRKDLRELDYGLWQGLTMEEIRHRQPRLYRQWLDAPASTCPPSGETLASAQKRLCRAVGEIVRRGRNGRPLIVLRPVALGLLKCAVRGEPIDQLWQHVQAGCAWDVLDADAGVLSGR